MIQEANSWVQLRLKTQGKRFNGMEIENRAMSKVGCLGRVLSELAGVNNEYRIISELDGDVCTTIHDYVVSNSAFR